MQRCAVLALVLLSASCDSVFGLSSRPVGDALTGDTLPAGPDAPGVPSEAGVGPDAIVRSTCPDFTTATPISVLGTVTSLTRFSLATGSNGVMYGSNSGGTARIFGVTLVTAAGSAAVMPEAPNTGFDDGLAIAAGSGTNPVMVGSDELFFQVGTSIRVAHYTSGVWGSPAALFSVGATATLQAAYDVGNETDFLFLEGTTFEIDRYSTALAAGSPFSLGGPTAGTISNDGLTMVYADGSSFLHETKRMTTADTFETSGMLGSSINATGFLEHAPTVNDKCELFFLRANTSNPTVLLDSAQ